MLGLGDWRDIYFWLTHGEHWESIGQSLLEIYLKPGSNFCYLIFIYKYTNTQIQFEKTFWNTFGRVLGNHYSKVYLKPGLPRFHRSVITHAICLIFFLSLASLHFCIKPILRLLRNTYMGSSAQDGENEQYLALFFFFGALLWPNGLIFWSFVNCSEEILTVTV